MEETNQEDDSLIKMQIADVFKVSYSPCLSDLITKLDMLDGETSKEVMTIWSKLQGVMGQSMKHQDLNTIIGLMGHEIACLYRPDYALNLNDDFLYVSWNRYASDLGQYHATYDLCLYVLNHRLKHHHMTYWVNKAVKDVENELALLVNKQRRELLIEKMFVLIKKVSAISEEFSLSVLFNLMQSSHFNMSSAIKTDMTSLIEDITANMPGVRVLDSIEPAGDRAVKNVCDRYQELVARPIRLAGIRSIPLIETTMNREFPWFTNVTSHIAKSLQLRQLGYGDFFLSPLLLVGGPGLGKTAYCLRLSELLNLPFRTLALGGKTDNRDLAGTARGWSGGHPSMLIQLINKHKVANPLIMLDELDKSGGSDHNGRITDTLLMLLESRSAKQVYDDYLCGHCDFSHISWVATANSVQQLPAAILSRFDVITIDKPAKEHYPAIVHRCIGEFMNDNGIHKSHSPA